MKSHQYLLAGLLAAGLAASASAQGYGDLFIGFNVDNDPGTATNVQLDVGSVASFQSATGTTVLGNVGSALTAQYGSGWATRSDLWYGVAGTVLTSSFGVAGNTLWIGSAEQGSSPAPAWQTSDSNTQSGIRTGITNLFTSTSTATGSGGTAISGLNGTTTGFGATLIAVTVPTSNQASWSTVSGNPDGSTGGFGLDSTIQNNSPFFEANANGVLDLYQVAPNGAGVNGKDLGFFTIGSDGTLSFTSFTASAIPEPSTYAAILGVATLGLIMARRRRSVVAE